MYKIESKSSLHLNEFKALSKWKENGTSILCKFVKYLKALLPQLWKYVCKVQALFYCSTHRKCLNWGTGVTQRWTFDSLPALRASYFGKLFSSLLLFALCWMLQCRVKTGGYLCCSRCKVGYIISDSILLPAGECVGWLLALLGCWKRTWEYLSNVKLSYFCVFNRSCVQNTPSKWAVQA